MQETKTNSVIEMNQSEVQPPWVFFDYSGTLVDTLMALSKTYTRFLGKDYTQEQVKQLYKDYPKMNKIAVIFKHKLNPIKMIFGGRKKFDQIRREEFLTGVRAFPGIPDVISRIKRMANVKMGIVTHEVELDNEEEREKLLTRFGIPNVFDAVITDYKNKETSFAQFLEEKKITHGILVSDTQFDLDLGKKYSLFTIGVTWGFSVKEELTADFIISDPRELLQIIMELLIKMQYTQLHGDPI